jgi:hypothetical protein
MLHPDAVSDLAAWYRREVVRRRGSPTPAETRRRLEAARKAAAAYADALTEFGQEVSGLAGLSVDELGDRVDDVEGDAARFGGAVEDLDARGAARGGHGRRLPDLFQPTPRWRLAQELADRLDAAGMPLGSAKGGALLAATMTVLTEAGEVDPERGLPDLLRQVLAARRSGEYRPKSAELFPSTGFAA